MVRDGSNNLGIQRLQTGKAGPKGSSWTDLPAAYTGQVAEQASHLCIFRVPVVPYNPVI